MSRTKDALMDKEQEELENLELTYEEEKRLTEDKRREEADNRDRDLSEINKLI